MHGKPCFGHFNSDELTKNENKPVLWDINIIKEKIDGRIKGLTCANGSIPRRYLKDGKTVASPKVSTKVIFASIVIDAYKRRDVGYFNVRGAYLHAENSDKKLLMKFWG